MFYLDVHFFKNRSKPGEACLFDRDRRQTFGPVPCLGEAEWKTAANYNNPTRDPLLPFGHTPTGEYGPAVVTRFNKPLKGYGPAWIRLTGVEGQAFEAWRKGRSGIGIHGGRGDEILRPTYGCIRLFQRDFDAIVVALDGAEIIVTVTEDLE